MRHFPNRPAICEAVREAVSKAWGSLADYPAPPYLINMPPACPYGERLFHLRKQQVPRALETGGGGKP